MSIIQKYLRKICIASIVMTFLVQSSDDVAQRFKDAALLAKAIFCVKFPGIEDSKQSNIILPFNFEFTRNQRNSMNRVIKLTLEGSSCDGKFTYRRGFYVGHVYEGTPSEGYHSCFIPSSGHNKE